MASNLLALSWRNHKSTFSHGLSALRSKKLYCDVTIACDGKFYAVHKFVLSTCSEYFEEILEQTTCKHPVIVLKDIESEVLEILLSYMYVGEVNVMQDKLEDIVDAAECLKIKGLAVSDELSADGKENTNETDRNSPSKNASSPPAKKRRRGSFFDGHKEIPPSVGKKINSSHNESQNSLVPSNTNQLDNEIEKSSSKTDQIDHKCDVITLKLEPVEEDNLIINTGIVSSDGKCNNLPYFCTDNSDPLTGELDKKSAESDWNQYESMSQEVDDAVAGASGVQGYHSPLGQEENDLSGFYSECLRRDEEAHDMSFSISETTNMESSFSAENYQIPMDKIPKKLKEAIERCTRTKQRLALPERRKFIRILADDVFNYTEKPGRKILKVIAEKVVHTLPPFLDGLEGGQILGSGYSSLLYSLEYRFDNLNRNNKNGSPAIKKIHPKMVVMKTKKRHAYGCINYAPRMTENEKLSQEIILKELSDAYKADFVLTDKLEFQMKVTYPLQRYLILQHYPIEQLLKRIPFLFDTQFFHHHCSSLTGFDINKSLKIMDEKVPKIIDGITPRIGEDNRAALLLKSIAALLGETDTVLCLEIQTSSPEDITDTSSWPQTPFLLYHGQKVWVAIERNVLFESTQPMVAVLNLLLSYFVFTIEYPASVGSTLEFIQRYLLQINPERGSKIEFSSGHKRHCNIHPKVLTLITRMSADEPLPSSY